MTDYSKFPYNCEECGFMYVCRYHELYDQHEQIIELLGIIATKVEQD